MSAGPLKKLKGNLYLGYRALIAHPLRKLFDTDPRSGKERFLANYAPEGLVPISLEDRAVLKGASRCIHCGLCDAYDPSMSALPRTMYDGASLLPVAYARATPGLNRIAAVLERLEDAALVKAERVCPTRVPLKEIAAMLKRKLAELRVEQAKLQTSESASS